MVKWKWGGGRMKGRKEMMIIVTRDDGDIWDMPVDHRDGYIRYTTGILNLFQCLIPR